MPIFNVSSLDVGSITSLYFSNPQVSSNNYTASNSCSFTCSSCNNNKLSNFYKKCGFNKYPIQASQINAFSDAQIDENFGVFSLSHPNGYQPAPPIRRSADWGWEAAKKFKETGSIYEGIVEGFNNGGLLVRFYSLIGFLPYPQLTPSYSWKEPKKTIQEIARGLIGSVIHMKVIDVDEESKKLIFSEKVATWSKYSEKIKEGDIFEGIVDVVEDYGAFIHLRFPDGKYHLTGLVHISEVSWDYVQYVRDALREGDIVRVKVVQVNREKSRITLSIRQLEEDPFLETWDKLIPQDGTAGSDSIRTSENDDIEPLPGLEEIFKELLKEDGISEVRIIRQGFEKRVVSQDLQFSLSNAPAVENQYTLLARAGSQVQEIQMTTTLDQEGIKKALQRVLEGVRVRVP